MGWPQKFENVKFHICIDAFPCVGLDGRNFGFRVFPRKAPPSPLMAFSAMFFNNSFRSVYEKKCMYKISFLRYRLARLDLHESGTIG
jgi:hypothetical protein